MKGTVDYRVYTKGKGSLSNREVDRLVDKLEAILKTLRVQDAMENQDHPPKKRRK